MNIDPLIEKYLMETNVGKYAEFTSSEKTVLQKHFNNKDFEDVHISPRFASATLYDKPSHGEFGTKFYVEKVRYGKQYVYSYAVEEFSEAGSNRTIAEEESSPFEEKQDIKILQNHLDKMMWEDW